MSKTKSNEVKDCLTQPDVHEQWENDYRSAENEKFYETVFDRLAATLDAKNGSSIVDVGCGIGAHSVRLANRGFRVTGIDFAQGVLDQAKSRVEILGLSDRVQFQQQDLLELTLPADSYDYVLCWGVLMHIPNVELAIAELMRIVKPGGKLIIGEGNMHSLQARSMHFLKRLLRKGEGTVNITPQGYETWTSGSAGTHVTRQANIGWIIRTIESDAYVLTDRLPGQFTELYTRFKNHAARRLIHCLNDVFFKFVPLPSLAQGNILIFKKKK